MKENIHQSVWQEVEEKYIPFVHGQFKSLPRRTARGENVVSNIETFGRILNSCAYMMAMFINYEQFGTSYYIGADNQPMPF